jgi:hypothetical protein
MSVQFAGQCPWAVSGKVWQKIRAVVALRAADTLGGSQAVSMALDVRQGGSDGACRWLWWNGIYTNLEFSEWTQLFENEMMLAALIDRVTFRSFVLNMNCNSSYRIDSTMNND